MTEAAYFAKWLTPYQPEQPTLVCLHGFTGTGATWQSLAWPATVNVLAVDLIGHGRSPVFVHPTRYRMTQVVAELQALLAAKQISAYHLLGYSMGARVALAWALADPHVISVILESGRPGLADPTQRLARQQQDNALAAKLLTAPLVEFVNDWEKLPLFASQRALPAAVQARVRAERLSQQPFGLAMSLMMMGTGQQPNYWPQLAQLPPGLLLVGEQDAKFQRLNLAMQAQAPQLDYQVLPGGHCVHLEHPTEFLAAVITWLKQSA